MTGKASWPWMAAGLALILLALGVLRDPVPDAPTPDDVTPSQETRPPETAPPAVASDPTHHVAEPDESPETSDDPSAPQDGDGNPFAVFLAPPDPLTDGQEAHVAMSSLEVTDDRYSPRIEAHQLFAPFEQALIAAEPLSPGVYKALLTEFKEHNMKVLKRADWLRKAGDPEAAVELMAEWGRLFDHYKAQAYGRAPVPTPIER